jgi:hypothetical protein
LPDVALTKYSVPVKEACKVICAQIFCGQSGFHCGSPPELAEFDSRSCSRVISLKDQRLPVRRGLR